MDEEEEVVDWRGGALGVVEVLVKNELVVSSSKLSSVMCALSRTSNLPDLGDAVG